jgi:hypothetical protein
MGERKVPLNEVKMHFLLADSFRENFEKPKTGFLIDDTRRLTKEYERLFVKYVELTEIELDELFTDETRLSRYDSLDWYKGDIELSKIGPWPEMKGLDIRLTTGNVPETVRRVREVWYDNSNLSNSSNSSNLSIPLAFNQKIDSIINHVNFVYPRFPIILTPGGTERGFHNQWVRNGGEGLIKQGQEKDWLCQIYDYDVDSGNARAFSYSALGMDKVDCYFGRGKS